MLLHVGGLAIFQCLSLRPKNIRGSSKEKETKKKEKKEKRTCYKTEPLQKKVKLKDTLIL